MAYVQREWIAQDDDLLVRWLWENMDMHVGAVGNIVQGVQMASHEQRVSPPQVWLDSLQWDGVPRLGTWLHDYLGAKNDDYHWLVGQIMLRGAVARVMQPGCKFDYCMVLQGGQGAGKSSALRILGGEWFSDTPMQIGKADGYAVLRGALVVEVQELDSFARADATAVKQLLTTQVDVYREAYARRAISVPRQCVFFATTNTQEYLKDSTGARRFFPVAVEAVVDTKGLAVVREQLWAEAVQQYKAAEALFPSREEEKDLIMPQQQMRTLADPWEAAIEAYLTKQDACITITALDIMVKALGMDVDRIGGSRQEAARIAAVMADLGWEKCRYTSGARGYYYTRPHDMRYVGAPVQLEVGEQAVVVAAGRDDEGVPF